MADSPITFASISTDAPNVYIARQTYRIAERQLVLGSFATRFSLPQRMGKTLRIVRHKRIALPIVPLTEGTPPDAVAIQVENVDVTVEQWGIVALLTDVAQITTVHPALQVAIDRTGLAMSETLEREVAQVLMGGTSVFYPAAVASRAGLVATDKMSTAVVLKTTVSLRAKGASEYESGLFGGVMAPQQEADVTGADTAFQGAAEFNAVRKLEYAEIGTWQGIKWKRGNFLPFVKGVAAVTTGAATAEKTQITATDGGGTITSATNFKFVVVARDINSHYERKISVPSANIASAATGNNESFTFVMPSSTAYVYDIYMTTVAGAGSGALYKVKSDVAAGATSVVTAGPAGTEAVAPASPADQIEVFMAFVFGKDAFGRVELNGMSLESYITPPGSSWSNPLAQGRKCGSKIMWKCFLIENQYFARIETGSAYASELAA